MINKVYK